STGYFLTASYDSATRQSVKYTYGRSTANQGTAAHYGWQDPDGSPDGVNSVSLMANDDQTIPAASRVYNILGDPNPADNLPAIDGKYTVQFKLTASTPTVTPGNNSTVTAYLSTEYSTNGGMSWISTGGTSQV